ncbi:MAG: SMP-30/gluconolactonase/LRE family protein [Saprospiraceae bacterium]|nr:SMP-30/gluconolactonase/LRE family protein [Saprospiraceae bacterium]
MRTLLLYLLLVFFASCQSRPTNEADTTSPEEDTLTPPFGNIERMDAALESLIPSTSSIEVLSEGYDWIEGPVWVASENMLLFSDIPKNSIFQWKEGADASLYLKPSGYTGDNRREGEPGSNGLLIDSENRLVLCQHGDRRIARMSSPVNNPQPQFETIVDNYQGKKLNSPNDATYSKSGDLYFTDPPYGLEGNMDDPTKEIPFQGVYRVKAGTSVAELLIDSISRPNGIALSPDQSKLYVACSDPKKAVWYVYDLEANQPVNGHYFYDVTNLVGSEKGLPDGMKVHSSGALFATGPGGVWIFNADGKVLGKIKTGQATANCAFDAREQYLYITADMYLLRVKLT